MELNQNQEQKQVSEKPKKSKACLITTIVIVIIIIVLFVGYFGLAYVLRVLNEKYEKTTTNNSSTTQTSEISDSELVGIWETDCLVPDTDSPWAEKHSFEIKSDGTAIHKRWTGENCASISLSNTDNFTIKILQKGQIDLTSDDIGTIYDIYEVRENALKFGHGFCNCVSSSTNLGQSEDARFDRLNQFLIYKKK